MIRPRRSARWAALLICAALAGGCRPDRPVIEKTRLVRLPAEYIPQSAVISEDGGAWAFVQRAAGGEHVVTAAGAGPVHDQCVGLVFAPKSRRLFHWTRDGAGEATRIAIVADGAPIATDFIASGQLGFSADGTRWFAAGAAPGPAPNTVGDITLFVDGAAITREADVSLPSFSADGAHVAYLTATDRRRTLVVDGAARRTFEPPTALCGAGALSTAPHPDLPLRHVVKYLADGSLLVVTRDPDGWGIYRDDGRLASYPVSVVDHAPEECATAASFAPRSLRTAERAPVAVWWERAAGKQAGWRVVRNGEPVDDLTCTETWKQHPPEPSADGTRVVYPCLRITNGVAEVSVVAGTARYGPYGSVWGIAPSKNDAHVAYGAQTNSFTRPWVIEVDGERRAGPFASVWRPRVSDDGSVVAWEATLERDGRGVFGVNGRRIGSFDEILWGPELGADDRVAWIVRRGRSLTRVSVPLAVARDPSLRPRVVGR
jgi:hypothetical protein